jgi:rhamnose utilization protein RhaD (predicted bifunctional aldolase and dehydrogenase)
VKQEASTGVVGEDIMLKSAANPRLENLWDDAVAKGMSEPELLLYRSNLLGSDKRITNYGGGNTSAKVMEKDPLTGEQVEVLWVKGSGGDIGSIRMDGFATLYMDKLSALKSSTGRRVRGRDGRLPAPLHLQPQFTRRLHRHAAPRLCAPQAHVDHMHADAIIAIAASRTRRS